MGEENKTPHPDECDCEECRSAIDKMSLDEFIRKAEAIRARKRKERRQKGLGGLEEFGVWGLKRIPRD